MTVDAVVIALLWLAAAVRIVVSMREGTAIWRTAFAVAVVAVAAGFTTYVYRFAIDGFVGAWNLGALLTAVLMVVAGGAAQVYLTQLRNLDGPIRGTLVRCGVTAGVAVGLVVSWFLAPLHDAPRDGIGNLLPIVADGWVVVHVVLFWGFMAWCTGSIARWNLARGLRVRTDGIPQRVGLVCIGLSCALGLIASVIFSAVTVVAHLGGTGITPLLDGGYALVAVGPLLLAVGYLFFVVIPQVSTVIALQRRWRWLGPLWRDMVDRHPEVHLPMPPSWSPLAKVQVRETRAVVEIHDALSLTAVTVPSEAGLPELAAALRHRQHGPRPASEVLPRPSTPQEGTQQLVELAQEYARAA